MLKMFDVRRTDVKRGQRVTRNAKRECLMLSLNGRGVFLKRVHYEYERRGKNNNNYNIIIIMMMIEKGIAN